jgi:hypothetical protein
MGVKSTIGDVGSDLTVGGTTFDTAASDHPILDTVSVTLSATPALTFPSEPYRVSLYTNFDQSNQAWIGFPDLIGPRQGDVLAAIDPTITYELRAQVEVRGTMSRSGAVISSGHYAFFPIGVSTYTNSIGSTDCTNLGRGIGCFAPGTFGAPACCDGLGSVAGCK